jgi:hypothetical protein
MSLMRLLEYSFVTLVFNVESAVRHFGDIPTFRLGYSRAPVGPTFFKPAQKQKYINEVNKLNEIFIIHL